MCHSRVLVCVRGVCVCVCVCVWGGGTSACERTHTRVLVLWAAAAHSAAVAVGGGGVILAASYEAKRFGVRTPMPGREAQRLCPGLIIVAPRS